jgi:hypothetical protein
MEYEKIILDLLMRVKTLEEKVEMLSQEEKEVSKKQAGTAEIKAYILSRKQEARELGVPSVTMKANEIHKAMGLKSRMPAVCNAMKQSMEQGDVVLHETASGFSSTYEILYYL